MLFFPSFAGFYAPALNLEEDIVFLRHVVGHSLKSSVQRREVLLSNRVLRVREARDVYDFSLITTHNFGYDTTSASQLFPSFGIFIAPSASGLEFAIQNLPNSAGCLATVHHIRVVHSDKGIRGGFRKVGHYNSYAVVVQPELVGAFVQSGGDALVYPPTGT